MDKTKHMIWLRSSSLENFPSMVVHYAVGYANVGKRYGWGLARGHLDYEEADYVENHSFHDPMAYLQRKEWKNFRH